MARGYHNQRDGQVIVTDDDTGEGYGNGCNGNGDGDGERLPKFQPSKSYSTFNAADILALLRNNITAMALFFATIVIGSLVYVQFTTPIYRAKVLIQVASERPQNSLSNLVPLPLAQDGQGKGNSSNTEFAIMKSDIVTSQVYAMMAENAELGIDLSDTSPEKISENIKIVRQLATDLYHIIVDDTNPVRAAFVANTILSAYLKNKSQRTAAETAVAGSWIRAKVKELGVGLEESSAKLKKLKASKGLVASFVAGTEAVMAKLSQLNEEHYQQEVKLQLMQSYIVELKKYLAADNLEKAVLHGYGSSDLARDVQEITTIDATKKEIAKVYLPGHPRMDDIASKRRQIRDTLRMKLEASLTLKANQIEVARQAMSRLDDQMDKLKAVLDDSKISGLQRQIFLDKKMIESLIEKEKELEFTRSLNNTAITTLKPAITPASPYKPKKLQVIGIALLAGFLGAILVIIGLDIIKPSILSEMQVESNLGIPVIKSIGKIKKDDSLDLNGHLFLFKTPGNPHAEIFRYVKTNMDFLVNEETKLFMVSSPEVSDGKSFIASNLATAFALGDRKTLLLELDMRKPRLTRVFKLSPRRGLHAYFSGHEVLENCIVKTQLPNLDLLLCGRTLSNPVEIMGSKKFKTMMAEIRQRYEVVIVDTPKILGLSDAVLIARYVDAIILAACGGRSLGELCYAIKLINRMRSKVKGIILNRMPTATSHYYYQYAYREVDESDDSDSDDGAVGSGPICDIEIVNNSAPDDGPRLDNAS